MTYAGVESYRSTLRYKSDFLLQSKSLRRLNSTAADVRLNISQ